MNYSSYEQMLSDKNIDAVAIGNYYGARGKMTIDALKAGKHVISDKPLCISDEELSEIRKLSEEKNLAVCLMLDLRDNGSVRTALELAEQGIIGKINNIYI